MHSYPSYPAPSGEALLAFVRQNPFAIVCTSGDAAPVATHLPIVFPAGDPGTGDTLVGRRLWGHIGRANPHWKRFESRPDALLVFTSSHAYVSPSVYRFSPAVPTLDYAAVHLTGRVSVITDRDQSLAVVRQTVHQLEHRRAEAWDPSDSLHVFEEIIDEVVSFTVDIEGEAAMFKLSQDMPRDVHARVREDLEHGEHRHPDVAELMRRVGVDEHPAEGTRPPLLP